MDTVDFGQVFALTAVDIYSREVDILLRPSLLAADGEAFLKFTMPRCFGGFIQTIQTDGGSESEAEFLATAPYFCRRYHPNEASDRASLQEE